MGLQHPATRRTLFLVVVSAATVVAVASMDAPSVAPVRSNPPPAVTTRRPAPLTYERLRSLPQPPRGCVRIPLSRDHKPLVSAPPGEPLPIDVRPDAARADLPSGGPGSGSSGTGAPGFLPSGDGIIGLALNFGGGSSGTLLYANVFSNVPFGSVTGWTVYNDDGFAPLVTDVAIMGSLGQEFYARIWSPGNHHVEASVSPVGVVGSRSVFYDHVVAVAPSDVTTITCQPVQFAAVLTDGLFRYRWPDSPAGWAWYAGPYVGDAQFSPSRSSNPVQVTFPFYGATGISAFSLASPPGWHGAVGGSNVFVNSGDPSARLSGPDPVTCGTTAEYTLTVSGGAPASVSWSIDAGGSYAQIVSTAGNRATLHFKDPGPEGGYVTLRGHAELGACSSDATITITVTRLTIGLGLAGSAVLEVGQETVVSVTDVPAGAEVSWTADPALEFVGELGATDTVRTVRAVTLVRRSLLPGA